MGLWRAHRPSETLVVWDLPLRIFHWLLALSTALAFVSADQKSALASCHIASGWCAAVLIVFRIVWGLIGGRHSRFASFIRPSLVKDHLRDVMTGRTHRTIGHDPVGGIAIVLMLGTLIAVIDSGRRAMIERDAGLHGLLAWTVFALIALHVVAVIAKSLLQRENLANAMITGRKSARKHPGARRRGQPSPAAFMLAVAIAAAAANQIHRLDPDAFSLHRPDRPAPVTTGDRTATKLADSGGTAGGAVSPNWRDQN